MLDEPDTTVVEDTGGTITGDEAAGKGPETLTGDAEEPPVEALPVDEPPVYPVGTPVQVDHSDLGKLAGLILGYEDDGRAIVQAFGITGTNTILRAERAGEGVAAGATWTTVL